MMCFEIAHSYTCKGLWNGKGRARGRGFKEYRYSVSLSHPVYTYLVREYGVPTRTRKNNKRKAGDRGWEEGWDEDEVRIILHAGNELFIIALTRTL